MNIPKLNNVVLVCPGQQESQYALLRIEFNLLLIYAAAKLSTFIIVSVI